MTVHDDITKSIFPIAFLFTLNDSLFLIPLAGDVEAPISDIEPSLELIQVYLSTESLLKVTSNAKRQLRLLDLYAQRHVHHHFITSRTCRALRDVDLLSWLLDPDSTHTPLAVCTPREEQEENTEEQKRIGQLTENLFHLLNTDSSSDPITSLWSQEIPEKALRQLLEDTRSLHVIVVLFIHLRLSYFPIRLLLFKLPTFMWSCH